MSTDNTTLRCKPGDLALVVRSSWDAGKMVTCLALATAEELKVYRISFAGPVWRVDRALQWSNARTDKAGDRLSFAPDRSLMPIRPEPDPEDVPEHAVTGEGSAL